MTRQIIFDTETTGLSPKDGHRVIEIGCVELINRKVTGNNFHYYLNPDRDIDEESIQVHGLTREFLSRKPRFFHIVDEFLEYIKGAELIAHNARFDEGFLNYELSLVKNNLGKLVKLTDVASITDSLELAKKLHPGARNSLDALCKRYQIDNTERNLHGALLDSMLLAEVYLAMTGGQGSFDFFEAASALNNKITQEQDNISKNSYNNEGFVIIKANEAELQSHQEFLELIQKQADDGCLWLGLKGNS